MMHEIYRSIRENKVVLVKNYLTCVLRVKNNELLQDGG
jgi:hypothetical protein